MTRYQHVNMEGEVEFSSPTIFGAIAGLAQMPQLMQLSALSPNYFKTVLSTGYNLVDLMGNDTFNTKGNFAIHYRPDSKTELSVQSLIGTGKAPLYTGGTVYGMDHVVVQQHKLNLKRGGIKAKLI